MINEEKKQEQPFSRFYYSKLASIESKTKAFTQNQLEEILVVFFELYGFDPRYLITLIQSVLDLTSRAEYTSKDEVKVNLPFIASPALSRKDKNELANSWIWWRKFALIRKFEKELSKGERTVNKWSFVRSLFHEILHSIFDKSIVDLLLAELHLDKSDFIKAKKTYFSPLFVVKLVLDKVYEERLLWEEITVEEFKKREKKYGVSYAVLALYESYLSSLEEFVIRLIDESVAFYFEKKIAGSEDYHKFKQHEAFLGSRPDRIREYGGRLNYFYLPQTTINDLTQLCEAYNLFNRRDENLVPLIVEVVQNFFSFSSFQKCIRDAGLPKEILTATQELLEEVEAVSQEHVTLLSMELREYLTSYHQLKSL